jgi:sodium/hydrogen exchanger-like protein 6/7
MEPNTEEREFYLSWALLIQIFLLIGILWTSYYLHLKQIRAINETVVSIFAGKTKVNVCLYYMFYV